jgi:ABC-type transport system involved in multi-copper enzyme maturation permease subunit
MPIFDQGYQHWKGPLTGHAWRCLTIARHGVRVQLSGRIIRLMLLVAWVPAIALVVVLALWGLVEQGNPTVLGLLGALLPPGVVADPLAYRATIWTLAYSFFFKFEMFCIMLLVVVAGPNLISADLRFNAMPLYFSRPLGRWDYFLGKLGVIAALVAGVAVGPAVIAYGLGVCFSMDLTVVRDTWRLLVGSFVYGLVIVVSAGTLMLALSSMSRRSLYVGIAWVGLWLISSTTAGVLTGIEQGTLIRDLMEEEIAKEKLVQPKWDGKGNNDEWQAYWQAQQQARGRAQSRFQQVWGETAKTDWRPLFSYTGNLQRIGEELLDADGAWVQLAKNTAVAPKGKMLGGPRLMGQGPGPVNERRLADQMVPQYPWWWSAGILAGLLGISVCTLSARVKSLDRLR